MAFRRTASSTREIVAPSTSDVGGGGGEGRAAGGGFDKRTIGALVLELSLTAVGYYVLYLSAKSLIGMMDPTKKDRASSAKVRVGSKGVDAGCLALVAASPAQTHVIRASLAYYAPPLRWLTRQHNRGRPRRRWRRSLTGRR